MAVYTEVSDDELAAFLADYDAGDLMSYKGIAEGVENTNYIVHTTREPLILTLYEKRVATADLPFFIGLMEHLAANGVPCPLPKRNRDGRALGTLAGRTAALVTFLEGICHKRPRAEHCREVGGALARLHIAGADYTIKRTNALGPAGWQPLFDKFADRADEIAPGLGGKIARELAELVPSWPADLPGGVIHADLFPDNVFFIGNEVSGLIDFYFACNDAFAYDLAICINAWCFDGEHLFDAAKGRALIEGYSSVRALTATERDALPTLARGAALRFLLTRSYDWLHTPKGAIVKPHDPLDYVARLDFHGQATSFASYLGEAA